MKKIFKYRHWEWWRFDFYLFQERRYELGVVLDGNGYWLLAINLIFLHIEFNFIKGFYEWKRPSYPKDIPIPQDIIDSYDFDEELTRILNEGRDGTTTNK